jgi:hypothetical protein
MSYQEERDRFIDQVSREGLPVHAARALLRQATTINRLAELACSSEAADRDRIPCPASRCLQCGIAYDRHSVTGHAAYMRLRHTFAPGPCLCDEPNNEHGTIPRITWQGHQAEQRAIAAVPAGWRVLTDGDPRGYTLRVVLPSYAERNEGRDRDNLESIGVPAGSSRIRW